MTLEQVVKKLRSVLQQDANDLHRTLTCSAHIEVEGYDDDGFVVKHRLVFDELHMVCFDPDTHQNK